MRCKRCGEARGLIDGICDNCSLALYGCLFPWLDDHDHKVCEKVTARMSDEKECPHTDTELVVKSGKVRRVCKLCDKVVQEFGKEVIIEKVTPPIPDIEKI